MRMQVDRSIISVAIIIFIITTSGCVSDSKDKGEKDDEHVSYDDVHYEIFSSSYDYDDPREILITAVLSNDGDDAVPIRWDPLDIWQHNRLEVTFPSGHVFNSTDMNPRMNKTIGYSDLNAGYSRKITIDLYGVPLVWDINPYYYSVYDPGIYHIEMTFNGTKDHGSIVSNTISIYIDGGSVYYQ